MQLETIRAEDRPLSVEFCAVMNVYFQRALYYSRAQYRSAQIVEDTNTRLTVFLISSSILTVLLNSASWSHTTNELLTAARDLFGVVTVALAAIQYALNFSEKAAYHKLAGTEYSNVRRDIEIMMNRLKSGNSVTEREWQRLGDQYGLITKLAPMVNQKVWKKLVEEPLSKIMQTDGSEQRAFSEAERAKGS